MLGNLCLGITSIEISGDLCPFSAIVSFGNSFLSKKYIFFWNYDGRRKLRVKSKMDKVWPENPGSRLGHAWLRLDLGCSKWRLQPVTNRSSSEALFVVFIFMVFCITYTTYIITGRYFPLICLLDIKKLYSQIWRETKFHFLVERFKIFLNTNIQNIP